MKKISLFLFSLTFIISSCSNDDDNQTKNQFTVNTETYPLATGIIINLPENPMNVYPKEIHLYSNGVSFNGMNFSGMGDKIEFTINSANENDITGTYDYDNGSEVINKISSGKYLIDVDFGGGASAAASIASGTLTVEQSGTSYQITFEGTSAEGDVLVSYNGTLTVFD